MHLNDVPATQVAKTQNSSPEPSNEYIRQYVGEYEISPGNTIPLYKIYPKYITGVLIE